MNSRESKIKLTHFGNTANNAFFNFRLLQPFGMFTQSKVVNFVNHALSAPAWETIDFEVPDPGFVDKPSWKAVPGAKELHGEFVSFTSGLDGTKERPSSFRFALVVWSHNLLASIRKLALGVGLSEKFVAQIWTLTFRSLSRALKNRLTKMSSATSQENKTLNEIRITYGVPDFSFVSAKTKLNIVLEHGSVRWIANGEDKDLATREKYRNFVENAHHLWVTNLDKQTTDLAELIAAKRWAPLPHPYVLDQNVPFPGDAKFKTHLQELTNSAFTILMPTSMNWRPDHDKGALDALEAFIDLRRSGYDVGLITAKWGRQISEAISILKSAKVDGHVHWMQPQPRIALQRMMSNVDLVYDQFAIPCFGAAAIKTMESCTPLLAYSVSNFTSSLMGATPKWLFATSRNEIKAQTVDIYNQQKIQGQLFSRQIAKSQRDWLLKRHHHEITAVLQIDRYIELLRNPNSPADIYSWAQIPDHNSNEWANYIKGKMSGWEDSMSLLKQL